VAIELNNIDPTIDWLVEKEAHIFTLEDLDFLEAEVAQGVGGSNTS
jgi:hypothetical protein